MGSVAFIFSPLHPDFSKSHGLWSSNFGWVLWHLTPKWDQPSWDPGESVMSDAIVGMQLCEVAYQQSFHAFWFQASSWHVLPHQPSTLFAQKKKHLCFRVAWKSSVSHCLHKLILQSRILQPSAENASLASSLKLKLSATKPWLAKLCSFRSIQFWSWLHFICISYAFHLLMSKFVAMHGSLFWVSNLRSIGLHPPPSKTKCSPS